MVSAVQCSAVLKAGYLKFMGWHCGWGSRVVVVSTVGGKSQRRRGDGFRFRY